ncbi:BON domain-containing protein [Methylobacterium sp. J-026]|uniref:BON domain-containing protein n=1 Tax=Methylobacterium sp. J-026 TaxID=2836624 RepID=UPI001FB89C6E|nr:BON domain-containing protein [Methylobacterium sp. J-026]MCJ2136932.1 BON domain-containing protein [Methylobacterium sp. J-026]
MSPDEKLTHDVLAELAWDPSVTETALGASAKDGIVTLTGAVTSFAQKHAAEAAARRVNGVKAIAGEIGVDLPFDHRRTDADIAAAVVNRLDWDAAILPDTITAQVQDGWVTLNGAVDWNFQKDAAALDVRSLLGVVGLSNGITIKPRANANHIAEGIHSALGRSWFFDPKRVGVDVEGDRVRLTGSVHTEGERRLAAVTAWGCPGVAIVENDLAIL